MNLYPNMSYMKEENGVYVFPNMNSGDFIIDGKRIMNPRERHYRKYGFAPVTDLNEPEDGDWYPTYEHFGEASEKTDYWERTWHATEASTELEDPTEE